MRPECDHFRSRLRLHLLSKGVHPPAIDVPGGLGLASGRLINSMGLLETILLVERELGRELTETELTNENFDSLDAICRLAHPQSAQT